MNIKIQTKLFSWIALPTALGVLTAFVKNKTMQQSTDLATGFLAPSASPVIFYAVFALCCAIFVALGIFTLQKNSFTYGEKQKNSGYSVAIMLSGALIAVSGGLMFLDRFEHGATPLVYLSALFLAISGAAQLVSLKAKQLTSTGLCRLFPLFYIGLYLLVFYRNNARNPLTHLYAFEILAVVAMLYSLYMSAGGYFDKVRPRVQLIGAMLSLYMFTSILVAYILAPSYGKLFSTFGYVDCIMAFGIIALIWSEILRALLPNAQKPVKQEIGPEDDMDFLEDRIFKLEE